MADRPIIFSAPMVRALLDGHKTQTRRVLKPQPELNEAGLWRFPPMSQRITKRNWKGFCQTDDDGLRSFILTTRHAPYAPGDRLWVREAWRPQMDPELWCCVEYRADGARIKPRIEDDNTGECFASWCDAVDPDWVKHGVEPEPALWRSSRFMFRWASRLTLHVNHVRVQRLQEISAQDVAAEGACELAFVPPTEADAAEARAVFRDLWNSLHGPDAWDANPWVCAISFKVERENIDQARAPHA